MSDRRRHHRVIPEAHRPVEIQIMGPGFLEIVAAINVSVGGVGFHVPHGLDPTLIGRPVELILTLPRCRPVHLRGIVRHLEGYTDPCHLGIEFVRLPPGAEEALERFVDLHQHRPYVSPTNGD